jgi:hypothetical protein
MINAIITNTFKQKVWQGDSAIDNTLNVLILSGTSAIPDDTIRVWTNYNQISAYEVVGSGYTAKGQVLSGTYETSATNNASIRRFYASNLTWPNASIVGDAIAIIDTDASDTVVCYIPFNAQKEVVNGTLFLNWPSNGIINLQ